MLKGHAFAAKLVVDTELRVHALPLRHGSFKMIDEYLPNIPAIPVIPNLAKEVAPIVRVHGPVGDNGIEVTGMSGGSILHGQSGWIPHLRRDLLEILRLHAWDKLHFSRPDFILQETVNIQRPLGVHAIHDAKRVKGHTVPVEHLCRSVDLVKGGLAILGEAIEIM